MENSINNAVVDKKNGIPLNTEKEMEIDDEELELERLKKEQLELPTLEEINEKLNQLYKARQDLDETKEVVDTPEGEAPIQQTPKDNDIDTNNIENGRERETKERIKEIINEISNLKKEKGSGPFGWLRKIKKNSSLKKERERLNNLLYVIKHITREIEGDKKDKAFNYFVIENCPQIKNMKDYLIEPNTGLVDLRKMGPTQEEINIEIPLNSEDRKKELLLRFNIFGFGVTVNNINRLLTTSYEKKNGKKIKEVVWNWKITDDDSKQFNVINENGEYIGINLDSSTASKIYHEVTQKRKEELLEKYENNK